MASTRDSSDKPFRLWVDPFTEHIVVEADEYILKFRNVQQIREYIYLLLNETNKMEYHLTKSVRGARKGRKIGKKYATTAIKDWEQALADFTSSDDHSKSSD